MVPTKSNLTDEETTHHLGIVGYAVFQKDAVPVGQDKPPVPTNLGGGTLEFRERLFALKEMALTIAAPRIEEYFVNQFNRVYPNFTYNNGLKVKSLDNMKTAYCTEPYNNQMREMIYYCMNLMWAENGWATIIESKVMAFLRLRYTDKYGICDTKEPL